VVTVSPFDGLLFTPDSAELLAEHDAMPKDSNVRMMRRGMFLSDITASLPMMLTE
jgi:hypothetical protein